jgi:hypothetical protein
MCGWEAEGNTLVKMSFDFSHASRLELALTTMRYPSRHVGEDVGSL